MTDRGLISKTIDRADHTVLVVDANALTRQGTGRQLRAGGFQTVEVGTGAEALAGAQRCISAVVLDSQLPDINGFEVCRRLRVQPETAKLPVMHLSDAYIRKEDQGIGVDAGADAYLIHPVEPTVLIATLQALIRARTAEDEVRRSETRFRAIYSNAQSGIALVDALGRFADVNPAMEQLLGRTQNELIGHAVSEFAPPQQVKAVHQKMQSIGEEDATWEYEFPLLTRAGDLVHLNWHMSSHVEPGLRVGIVLDVTERILLDQRRQELLEREQAARRVAESHGRTKDDFISVLSHELRTPLNTIQGWVEVLKRRGTTTPEVAKGLEIIDRNVRAQARMVGDVLDVSRLDSGQLQLNRDWTDPAQLVAECVASLRASADAKRLAIQQTVAQAQPAWMDAQRFEQICKNLLTNAIKFSHPGGTITIVLVRQGDVLQLSVRDEGLGIDPEFVGSMFEPFTQGNTPGNRSHGGLGLGLSIVKHLAELHGGTVVAHSAGLGHGATVTVEILVTPPTGASDTLGAAEQQAGVQADDSQALQGVDVLIVEDNADALEVLSVILREHHATVRTACDFDAALARVAEAWPDVVVCDIGLPGRDGYQVVTQLRQRELAEGRHRLPCIALTAFARPADEANALAAGFDKHIAKPPRPGELLAAIRQLKS